MLGVICMLAGLMIGGATGVGVMCLMNAAKCAECQSGKRGFKKDGK